MRRRRRRPSRKTRVDVVAGGFAGAVSRYLGVFPSA